MKKGFSLIELVIVIAVIGILVAILIPVFSQVIKKSVAKSALSDARNTVDAMLTADDIDEKETNAVVAVEKNGKLFVFGWFSENGIILESKLNPIEIEDGKSRFDILTEKGCFAYGSEPVDISSKLDDKLPSATIYGNCSLASLDIDIIIEETASTIGVNEIYDLQYDLMPYYDLPLMPVILESSDPSVAEVDGSAIIGKAPGQAKITAHYGNVSKSIAVTVANWTDFDGNFAELKAAIESGTEPLLLRLTNDLYLEDYSGIFPIVVPKDRIVRLNFNLHTFEYRYTKADSRIEYAFVNDGGYFAFGVNTTDKMSNGSFSINGYNDCEPVQAAIFNINSARLTVGASLQTSGTAVKNEKAACIIADKAVLQNTMLNPATINAQGGILSVTGGTIHGITNHGTIKKITDGKIISAAKDNRPGDAIANHGLIDIISGGAITANRGDDPTKTSAAICCTGKNATINHISNGKFNAEGYIDDMYEGSEIPEINDADLPNYCIKLDDGSHLGSITGGIFYSYNVPLKADKIADAKHKIYGGKFLQCVENELLGKGCVCEKQDFLWFVSKK